MTFKRGDKVVYPHHGAATVVKKEMKEAFGVKTEYLVLRMAHGEMVLSVPVDKAEEVGMRWPISTEDVEDLFEVLRKRDVREPANWSRRFKNHQEKLKSGDVYQVAEVVRNLALRDQNKGLSAGEKSLFTKARNVLVSELSFSLNVSEDEALGQSRASPVLIPLGPSAREKQASLSHHPAGYAYLQYGLWRSLVSAPALGAGGRRFKSGQPDRACSLSRQRGRNTYNARPWPSMARPSRALQPSSTRPSTCRGAFGATIGRCRNGLTG